MPSSSDVATLVRANQAIRKLGLREFTSLWSLLNLDDALSVKRVLLAEMPLLVEKYGDLAATVAADLYEQWRDGAGARGAAAVLAPAADPDRVAASVRYSIGGLFGVPDTAAVFSLLAGDVLDRLVSNQARQTFELNAKRDRVRFARVPVGATCEWCVMLGSRGAMYRSSDSAGASHGNCDCVVVPSFEDDDLPEGYDPDALYAQWQDMRAERLSQASQR